MHTRGFAKRALAVTALCLASGVAARAAQPLVVYCAVGYGTEVGKAFEHASGIPVRMVTMSTGPLLARVQAEKRNPQWNVVWFDGAEAMRGLAMQGLLKPFAPTVAWNALGRRLQPGDRAYVVTAATLAGAIVVDARRMSAIHWPRDWSALTDPEYRDKIGMNNPAVSGPTYPFVAGQMQWRGGEAAGKRWFLRLKANGLETFRTNAVTLRALQYGQIDVAMVQNVAGIGRAHAGLPFAVIYPNPVTLLPRTIAIGARSSPALQEEAERFVAFLLSKRGQQIALAADPSGDSNYYPVLAGVRPNAAVPSLTGVTVQSVDPAVWGLREAEIDRWFTDHVVH